MVVVIIPTPSKIWAKRENKYLTTQKTKKMKKIGNLVVKTTVEEILNTNPKWISNRVSNRLINGESYLLEGSTTVEKTELIPQWEGFVLRSVKGGSPIVVSGNVLSGSYYSDGDLRHIDGCPFMGIRDIVDNIHKTLTITAVQKIKTDVFGSDNKVMRVFYSFIIEDSQLEEEEETEVKTVKKPKKG